MKLPIGSAARSLRESFGLTQRAMAEILEISPVHLCNIENDKAMPSQALIDKYRDLFEVDIYVFAWCRHGDTSKLPVKLRQAAAAMSETWQKHIEDAVNKNKESSNR